MKKLTNDNMNYIASGKYITKMQLLDGSCSLDNIAEDKKGNPLLHRDDTVRDKQMPVHMMYKYGAPLISKDGCRAYTFNIEYCTDAPSEGIYYGAFGVVLRGTIDEHKESFDREWAVIRPIAAQVLGNTFDNPYFNMLFRQTDNVNDNTYWPFWISLSEDEDIVEVAFRAVKIIRRIYETYFAGKIDWYNPIPRKKQSRNLISPVQRKHLRISARMAKQKISKMKCFASLIGVRQSICLAVTTCTRWHGASANLLQDSPFWSKPILVNS